jgi:hypothetical protein
MVYLARKANSNSILLDKSIINTTLVFYIGQPRRADRL